MIYLFKKQTITSTKIPELGDIRKKLQYSCLIRSNKGESIRRTLPLI